MPEKTCSTCQCNKVCDHNKYGFENCGNYISDDVVPRYEVERIKQEIFEELETVLYSVAVPVIRADGRIGGKTLDGLHIRIEDYNTIKKKYTEDGK